MRRIISSTHHAASLLHNLGLRRFLIVLLWWTLQRYRPILAPLLARMPAAPKANGLSHDPILIYQMPKVGSTSLIYSLQLAYLKIRRPDIQLYHVHTLTNLDIHEQLARSSPAPARQLAVVRQYKNLLANIEAQLHHRWTAISMVRDPVARQVSDYFHHLDRHLPNWRQRWRKGALTVDEVLQNFLSVPDLTPQWFDAEIKSIFGIDVFSSQFPHQAGYCLYSRPPKITLMVIRLEDMNRVANHAVEQLLGIQQFKLYSFNQGHEASYRDLYKQFKKKPLPAAYIENAYAGKLAQHFYTDSERNQFKTKWTHASPTPLLAASPATR